MTVKKSTKTKKTASSKTTVAKKEATVGKKETSKTSVSEKVVYVFFNCNESASNDSMNIRYNNQAFADTESGRKALLKKVVTESEEGRINFQTEYKTIETAILKGDPTEISSKVQYGDIKKVVLFA